jgi:hypothetical protein
LTRAPERRKNADIGRRVVIVCVVALAIGPGAHADQGFTDPRGDSSGPDVTAVAVSNTSNNLTVKVTFANRPTLAPGDVVLIDLDTDASAATGEGGVDLYAVLEGGEPSAVFVWLDGAFVPTGIARALFGSGTATLSVPLEWVKARLRVAVLAVGGPDPEVSPTDRAPASGSWAYAVTKVALRSATVGFTPTQPRAGGLFAVTSVSLALTTTAAKVRPDALACSSKLGSMALRPSGNCRWRLPSTARGKRLTVSISATYRGVRYRLPARRFTVR